MVSKNDGYTLLESLVVLAIMTLMLFFLGEQAQFDSLGMETSIVAKEFLSQVEQAQSLAVIKGEAVVFKRVPVSIGTMIQFEKENNHQNEIIKQIYLPEGVTVTKFDNTWIRSGTGYIQIQTISFYSEKRNVKITFQLGMGRYRVETTYK